MEKRTMVLKYFHLEMTHVSFHWLKEAIGHLTSRRPGNTIFPHAQRKGKGKILGVWQSSLPHSLKCILILCEFPH